jgi:hypothetical protein
MTLPGFTADSSVYAVNRPRNLQNSKLWLSSNRNVIASLINEGGDGCPDGTFACSCGDSSQCCDAYSEYCWTSPGGSCSCQAKPTSGYLGAAGRGIFGGLPGIRAFGR